MEFLVVVVSNLGTAWLQDSGLCSRGNRIVVGEPSKMYKMTRGGGGDLGGKRGCKLEVFGVPNRARVVGIRLKSSC